MTNKSPDTPKRRPNAHYLGRSIPTNPFQQHEPEDSSSSKLYAVVVIKGTTSTGEINPQVTNGKEEGFWKAKRLQGLEASSILQPALYL